jgi:hypothetical protein
VWTGTIPAHGLYFAGYEMAKRVIEPNTPLDQKGPLVHFVSGVWADICGSIIWVPMDVIKQRLQIQRNSPDMKYRGSYHALQTIYLEEGIKGLYKGYWPAIATYGPFVGIYFAAYEQSKKIYKRIYGATSDDTLPFLFHLGNMYVIVSNWPLVSGAQGGAIAAAITCPMDVIKTRLQVESTTTKDRYKNAFDATKRIMQEEGIRAFGKGMVPRILWIAPGTAITMAACKLL